MVQNPPPSPRRLLRPLLVAPPLLQALARRRRPPARPPPPAAARPHHQSLPPFVASSPGSIWVLSSRRFAWTAMITAAPARKSRTSRRFATRELRAEFLRDRLFSRSTRSGGWGCHAKAAPAPAVLVCRASTATDIGTANVGEA
ncbi:hypothetical protein NL676_030965 [Syzygium grande]|nr:hypothetical protein NL676_030965 [Syzygium grande]